MKHSLSFTLLLCGILSISLSTIKAQEVNSNPLPDAEIIIKTSAQIGEDYFIEVSSKSDVEVNWGAGADYEKVSVADLSENGGLYGKLKGSYVCIKSTEGISEIHLTFCKIDELSIKKAPNLYLLSATNNNLTTIEGLNNLPALEDLNVSRNKITKIPVLPNLKQLRINNNTISSSGDFNKMPNLEYLDCSNNAIKELDLSGLTHLKDLVAKETTSEIVNLTGCTALETVSLDKNKLTTLDLSKSTLLKKIEVGGNLIEKIILPQSENLMLVDLSPNNLSACALDEIYKSLPTLKKEPLGKNILVKNNPGAKKSKTDLLSPKKWIADVKGDGTGCETTSIYEIGSATKFMYSNNTFVFEAGANKLSIYSMDAEKIFSTDLAGVATQYTHELLSGQYIAVLTKRNGTKEILKITIQ